MHGVGLGGGWLGPPLFSVLANARAVAGGRGHPLHMTISTYLTSYTQCSHEFSSLILVLSHTYTHTVSSFWGGPLPLPHSFFLPLYYVHFLHPTNLYTTLAVTGQIIKPFYIMSSVRSAFSPFRVQSIRGRVLSRISPFGVESFYLSHSRSSPKNIQD